MIRRGTTPTHTFTFPFDTSSIKSLKIIYAQGDVEVFHKTKEDCRLDGNSAYVTLTQEETRAFNHRCDVQVQINALTLGGTSLVSNIERIAVRKNLNNEVMM